MQGPTALYPGHISRLCLQPATLRNEETFPPKTKNKLASTAIKAMSPLPVFLGYEINPLGVQEPSGILRVAPWELGLGDLGTQTNTSILWLAVL